MPVSCADFTVEIFRMGEGFPHSEDFGTCLGVVSCKLHFGSLGPTVWGPTGWGHVQAGDLYRQGACREPAGWGPAGWGPEAPDQIFEENVGVPRP